MEFAQKHSKFLQQLIVSQEPVSVKHSGTGIGKEVFHEVGLRVISDYFNANLEEGCRTSLQMLSFKKDKDEGYHAVFSYHTMGTKEQLSCDSLLAGFSQQDGSLDDLAAMMRRHHKTILYQHRMFVSVYSQSGLNAAFKWEPIDQANMRS